MRLDVRIEVRRPERPLEYAFETDAAVTGVFGPSGAGKTSLLNAIAGLLTPTAGVIRLDGLPVFDRDRKVDIPTHRRRIGVAFQDDRLFPHLRVAGNLRYGHGRVDAGVPGVSFDDVVELLDLRALLGRRVRNLSGGERRRVTIGRALLASPRLLLLDEPLSSLDLGHRRPILDLIRRLRDATGVPILYVSHDITEILELTDRLLVIEDGRSVAHGSLREIARDAHAWRTVRDLGPLNVFPVAIAAHDADAGLTALTLRPDHTDAEMPRLLAPLVDASVGTRGWASVRSEDIALARGRVDGVSIRNQLRATVVEITKHPDRALVEIDAGTSLLVEVSHQTVRQMELAKGVEVWCLMKSNAVELRLDQRSSGAAFRGSSR